MKAEQLKVKQDSQTMTLFDERGRCQPQDLSAPVHTQTRRYFQVEQPALDLDACYARLHAAFHIETDISLDRFKARVQALIDELAADAETKEILNGVMVPFILPKADYSDIGEALEQTYIPAVSNAFHHDFPEYSFKNHAPESVTGKLQVAKGSRHEQLISKMKNEPVVGLYFPCLLEYSIPAAIEQIGKLPKQFLLAGGFDTAAAFISMPDLLMRKDGYPPLMWMSGLESSETNVGYHFEAYGYDLTFNRRVHLGLVAEYWAHGLTIID